MSLIGQTLGQYQIVERIGAGGMAEVYVAEDTKLGRKVALKIIRSEALGDEKAVKRFLFEAKVTARFSHPNIVAIYEVGEYQGRPYLALEYLEGLEAEALERRIEFPWAEQLVERFGSPESATLAETILQITSHTTYHRGQVNTRLRELGGEPRLVDFIAWIWLGKPTPEWEG